MYFFYVDYGILYEELLVRAKKYKSCCIIIYDLCACPYIRVGVYFAFTYDDLFQQHGCNSSIELRNSSAFVIYIAIACMSESIRY